MPDQPADTQFPPDRHAPQSRRVLLVEDNFLVALAIAAVLRDLGFEVVGPAGALAEGLALAESGPVDAAVLDYDLGGEAVTPLAQLLASRHVPFVYLTGYDSAPGARPASGGTVLHKPVSRAELRCAMQRLLAGSARAAGSA